MKRSEELVVTGTPGPLGLAVTLAALAAGMALLAVATQSTGLLAVGGTSLAVLLGGAALLSLKGHVIVQPNYAVVMVRFGRYVGTIRHDGWFWVNPLNRCQLLSLRARNMGSERVKVNDLEGNPVMIGVVTVWQVRDTAQASFDVDDLVSYVDVQIETAVRELAQQHPYDDNGSDIPSLRADTTSVNSELQEALTARLERAGVHVIEARITHLAYAPEIAGAMLQRQQAGAIVAARQRIVEGAVGMVEQALSDLTERQVVELAPVERGRLVSNLLVVLCGQTAAQPVVQTGQ